MSFCLFFSFFSSLLSSRRESSAVGSLLQAVFPSEFFSFGFEIGYEGFVLGTIGVGWPVCQSFEYLFVFPEVLACLLAHV